MRARQAPSPEPTPSRDSSTSRASSFFFQCTTKLLRPPGSRLYSADELPKIHVPTPARYSTRRCVMSSTTPADRYLTLPSSVLTFPALPPPSGKSSLPRLKVTVSPTLKIPSQLVHEKVFGKHTEECFAIIVPVGRKVQVRASVERSSLDLLGIHEWQARLREDASSYITNHLKALLKAASGKLSDICLTDIHRMDTSTDPPTPRLSYSNTRTWEMFTSKLFVSRRCPLPQPRQAL